jgi:hypothetical protein
MGVTNGFLRLSRDEFSSLENDASAFEQRCRQYDHPDYLDMDKAGYELLFFLDPATVDLDNPDAASPVPAIAQVLGGGTIVHKDIDLGYGPAQRISNDSMQASLAEFEHLDYDQCYAMASTDLMSEVFLVEMDEEIFREYHWSYLQSLGSFIKEAVERDMVVLRY